MTDKRKTIDMIAPTYEDGWLFRLAHQRRWTLEETFVLNASPDECFAHIRNAPKRGQYCKYTVAGQGVGSIYQFKVQVDKWSSRNKGPGNIRLVVGQIVPYEGDNEKSLVMLRTYPAIKELVKYELFMIIWLGFICFVEVTQLGFTR